MKTTAILLAALALPIAAQTAKPTPAPAAPTISDAQRAEFFKAQAIAMQAAGQAKEKQDAFQTLVVRMQSTCGTTSTLQMNQVGDPVCILKPAEKK